MGIFEQDTELLLRKRRMPNEENLPTIERSLRWQLTAIENCRKIL
jgi:hypothetical protein